MDDLWVLWPDGFMIPLEELDSEEWNHRSDDYMTVAVIEYEEDEETPKCWRYFK